MLRNSKSRATFIKSLKHFLIPSVSILLTLIFVSPCLAASFKITAQTTTKVSASSHSKPPVHDSGELGSSAVSTGGENSQCQDYGRASSASGYAKVTEKFVSENYTEARVGLIVSAESKGGHFRTCSTCIANHCIGIQGHDTKSTASGRATAAITIAFSNDTLPGQYLIGVNESFQDQGAQKSIILTDNTGKKVERSANGWIIDALPNSNFLIHATVEADTANKGYCCEDQKNSSLLLSIMVDRLPELENVQPFILGGNFAKGYPEVGMLQYKNRDGSLSPHCTGTLISKSAILTAAHCVADDYEPAIKEGRLRFILGYSAEDPNAEVKKITRAAYPNKSNSDTFIYRKVEVENGVLTKDDVAIAYLESDISIQPMLLESATGETIDKVVRSGEPLTFVGYGFYSISDAGVGSGAGKKRQAQVPISDVTETTFGYKSNSNGQNTCRGDSGGPALMETPPFGWKLVGITAYGAGDCKWGRSMRMDKYRNWIDANL
jgi:V8-like Glu-specific endopeptidase